MEFKQGSKPGNKAHQQLPEARPLSKQQARAVARFWDRELLASHHSGVTTLLPYYLDAKYVTGKRVLDVGCGSSCVPAFNLYQTSSEYLMGLSGAYTGVDISGVAIGLASKTHPQHTFVVADATRLPFPDLSFEVSVAFDTLELTGVHYLAVLSEMARASKDGIIFNIGHPDWFKALKVGGLRKHSDGVFLSIDKRGLQHVSLDEAAMKASLERLGLESQKLEPMTYSETQARLGRSLRESELDDETRPLLQTKHMTFVAAFRK